MAETDCFIRFPFQEVSANTDSLLGGRCWHTIFSQRAHKTLRNAGASVVVFAAVTQVDAAPVEAAPAAPARLDR